MNTNVLNEHDANQGAQSKGEFLGMGGNSSWYVLGAASVSLFIVFFLWGVCGFSLLACVTAGTGLCVLALVYVFTLKNNKPAHYDTDFFESVLIESGLVELRFGPRWRRPRNPFSDDETSRAYAADSCRKKIGLKNSGLRSSGANTGRNEKPNTPVSISSGSATVSKSPRDEEEMVPLKAYEQLKADLEDVEDQLANAIVESEEG